MSKISQPNGDDYPEAAKKHLDDAETLLQAGRCDGAGYLTGYIVECVLKTVIVLERGNAFYHHDLTRLSQSAIRLAAMPSARTAKYAIKPTPGHSLYDRSTGWRETLRYRRAAYVSPKDAADWLAEARILFAAAIIPMQLDGVV
jgi:HEPN domain-containing protein